MNSPPNSRHPFAEAIDWVGRITAIAFEMFLPGLAGQWLDNRYGTHFLALVGFAFGLTVGVWHLLLITKSVGQPRQDDQGDEGPPS